MERLNPLWVKCPMCNGFKGISGKSGTGHPATLICPRCEGIGIVDFRGLTDEEKNPKKKPFFERDDNP